MTPPKNGPKKGVKKRFSASGSRNQTKVNVRTARGRTTASTKWLQRQLNDPYVHEAKRQGYRSRAAFKLLQIDASADLFRKGQVVVDLGAAPGGWLQVAEDRVGNKGLVVGIDLLEIEPVAGTHAIVGDVTDDAALTALETLLEGRPVNVVLSDMANSATGHRATDNMRVLALIEIAVDFAEAHLASGGHFVAKVLQGGTEGELLTRLKKNFRKVRHIKPEASRSDSRELYVVATGFRGGNKDKTPTDPNT